MIRCVAVAIAFTTEPSYDLSHATHFGRSSSGPESTAATPARKPPTAWPQTFSAPALFLDMGQSALSTRGGKGGKPELKPPPMASRLRSTPHRLTPQAWVASASPPTAAAGASAKAASTTPWCATPSHTSTSPQCRYPLGW